MKESILRIAVVVWNAVILALTATVLWTAF